MILKMRVCDVIMGVVKKAKVSVKAVHVLIVSGLKVVSSTGTRLC